MGMFQRGCEPFIGPLTVKGTQKNVEEREEKESLWKINSMNTSTEMLQPLTYLETIKKSVWVTTGFMTGEREIKLEREVSARK